MPLKATTRTTARVNEAHNTPLRLVANRIAPLKKGRPNESGQEEFISSVLTGKLYTAAVVVVVVVCHGLSGRVNAD